MLRSVMDVVQSGLSDPFVKFKLKNTHILTELQIKAVEWNLAFAGSVLCGLRVWVRVLGLDKPRQGPERFQLSSWMRALPYGTIHLGISNCFTAKNYRSSIIPISLQEKLSLKAVSWGQLPWWHQFEVWSMSPEDLPLTTLPTGESLLTKYSEKL